MWTWATRLVRLRGAVAWMAVIAGGCGDAASPGPGGGTEAAEADAQGDDGGSASADDADTQAQDSSEGGVNEDGTGAPLPEFLCEDRSECVLHSDCCSCVALHVDQEVPECADESCERGMCEIWGIDRYLCSHTCHIELVECDASMVTCSDAPPSCEAGMVPSVDERCWSNHCVPTELCRPS